MDILKKQLYSISLVMLIDSMAGGLVLTILPQLILNEQWGILTGSSMSRAIAYSLALTVYRIMEFFGMSFFCTMSDRYGRKRLLIIIMGATLASYFLSTYAIIIHSFILFILLRGALGALAALYGIGNSILSDAKNTNEKEKLFCFKLPLLSNKLGVALGAGLAIFVVANMTPDSLSFTYLVATFLEGINFALLLFNLRNLPETKKAPLSQHMPFEWKMLFNAIIEAMRYKTTRWLLLSFLVFQIGSSLFTQALPLFLTLECHYTPAQIGFFSCMMGLIFVLSTSTLPYFGSSAESVGPRRFF